MLVAVVMEVLVAGVVEVLIAEVVEVVVAFLGSFSTCEGILEGLFNPKYRPIASSVQSEVFNDSSVSASTFMIAEL
jgi:hypothetical protein